MTEPVRYYIRASTELLRHPENWHQPDGWRIVREVGPVDQYTVLVEVEDDGAPAELASHVVQVAFEGRYAEGGTQTGVFVSYRELDRPFDTGFQIARTAGREEVAANIRARAAEKFAAGTNPWPAGVRLTAEGVRDYVLLFLMEAADG